MKAQLARVATAWFVILLGGTTALWAQATIAPGPPGVEWEKVRKLAPGTEVVVGVKGRAPARCWFLRADDSMLVVFEPVDGEPIARIRRATSGLGDIWSRVAGGGTVSLRDRRVIVSPDAIIDQDTTLARRLAIAKVDVTTVQSAVWGDEIARPRVAAFDQLPTALRPGDTVWVADVSGREVKGRLLSLSASSLALQTGGETRDLSAERVANVFVRGPNPLKNGAITGLVVGSGLTIAIGCAVSGCGFEGFPGTVLVVGGMGAAIGVAIDAAIPGKKTLVYSAPGSATAWPARAVSIAPFFDGKRTGVLLAVRF